MVTPIASGLSIRTSFRMPDRKVPYRIGRAAGSRLGRLDKIRGPLVVHAPRRV